MSRLYYEINNGRCSETEEHEGQWAVFSVNENKQAELIHWPMTMQCVKIPETIMEYKVTQIAACAFAPFHMETAVMEKLFQESSISLSLFLMMHAKEIQLEQETQDPYHQNAKRGPEEVVLPATIEKIGAYAFYECNRLHQIYLPDGITEIEAGTFGGCTALAKIHLPNRLEEIGYYPKDTQNAMPDTGAFHGCISLRKIVLPEHLKVIGAETFNSSGIRCVYAKNEGYESWSRDIKVHPSAFLHTASLKHMVRTTVDGEITWKAGLPDKKEKILSCDNKYGFIQKIPVLFFTEEPEEIDLLTKKGERIDFTGQMAIGRLEYPVRLSEEMESFYVDYLAGHFDKLGCCGVDTEQKQMKLLHLMADKKMFNRNSIQKMMQNAATDRISTTVLEEMIAIRNERFSEETGFEELEIFGV
mgnify:CR=1 FL=1